VFTSSSSIKTIFTIVRQVIEEKPFQAKIAKKVTEASQHIDQRYLAGIVSTIEFYFLIAIRNESL